jgi:heme exporter protein D
MTMYFNSVADLLAMDGHGVYVWSAVAITLVVMAWVLVAPLISRRQLLRDVARDIQRESQRQSAGSTSKTKNEEKP